MVRPKDEPLAAWLATESADEKRKRALAIQRTLKRAYPESTVALHFSNPLELVVATVLSAQSTDAMVNSVTPRLFAKYRTAADYANAPPGELESDIHSTGFFNQKAKNLRRMGRILLEEFGGDVPGTMAELLRLPGVARKTANIVLGNAFGIVEGIAVDTHVHRLSRRLGFSAADDPVKVERDLMALFPKKNWWDLTYLLIDHGRAICKAQRPACEDCVASDRCPASRLPERAPAAPARKVATRAARSRPAARRG